VREHRETLKKHRGTGSEIDEPLRDHCDGAIEERRRAYPKRVLALAEFYLR
jgi:hypothetical protein